VKGFFPCIWLRAPETVWPHCLAEPTPWPAGMLRRWVRRPILANDTSKREPFIQDTGALGQSPNPNPPVPFAFLCLRIPVFTKRSGIRLSGSLRISQDLSVCASLFSTVGQLTDLAAGVYFRNQGAVRQQNQRSFAPQQRLNCGKSTTCLLAKKEVATRAWDNMGK